MKITAAPVKAACIPMARKGSAQQRRAHTGQRTVEEEADAHLHEDDLQRMHFSCIHAHAWPLESGDGKASQIPRDSRGPVAL